MQPKLWLGAHQQRIFECDNAGNQIDTMFFHCADKILDIHFVDTRTKTRSKGIYVTSDAIRNKLDYILNLIDETELNTIVIDITAARKIKSIRTVSLPRIFLLRRLSFVKSNPPFLLPITHLTS